MDHSGMDVHKKKSQICILTEACELIERRVRTEPQRFPFLKVCEGRNPVSL